MHDDDATGPTLPAAKVEVSDGTGTTARQYSSDSWHLIDQYILISPYNQRY